MINRPLTQKRLGFFDRLIPESAISTEHLLIAGTVLSLIDAWWIMSPAGFAGFLGSVLLAIMVLATKINLGHNPAITWIKRVANGRHGRLGLLALLFFGSFLTLSFALAIEPSHAVFFQNAEKYAIKMIETATGTTAGTADTGGAGGTVTIDSSGNTAAMKRGIAFIFSALRIMFVIYVGAGLVNIVKAANENEDWKSAARTPAIIIMIVIMGDLIAEFITGKVA